LTRVSSRPQNETIAAVPLAYGEGRTAYMNTAGPFTRPISKARSGRGPSIAE
jgi:hypothetical protein